MLPTRQGSFRLFKLAGIQVYLHWTWFILAFYEMSVRTGYASPVWNALEYLALFAIVLMHEFGHALACRQVGGRADQIVLWPLGGVAYVAPPPRPGATLWSIAAGPLVNVILVPVVTAAYFLGSSAGWEETLPNVFSLVQWVWLINFIMLLFNLLPVYPLDGGQILRSLLWFWIGPIRSLKVAAVVGMIGAGLLCVGAILMRGPWLVLISVFILFNCWRGLREARAMANLAKLPRQAGYACPTCGQPPLEGAYWRCGKCSAPFDLFASGGICPECGESFPRTPCFSCGSMHPVTDWQQAGQRNS